MEGRYKVGDEVFWNDPDEGRYKVGDEVFWNDPDNGLCSGYGIIIEYHPEIVTLKMHSGSEVEAFLHEIQ